jgi:hypothetical protein
MTAEFPVQHRITVLSKKQTKKIAQVVEEGKAAVVDVTSKGADPLFAVLSPFHPYCCSSEKDGKPYFDIDAVRDCRSYTVEGAWHGLKVFEFEGIDKSKFSVRNGKNLKRSLRSKLRGKVLGHLCQDGIVKYVEARKRIYLPLYNKMLDHPVAQAALEKLYEMHLERDLVLLDYCTNEDVECTTSPLSHAGLVKARLLRMYGERNSK